MNAGMETEAYQQAHANGLGLGREAVAGGATAAQVFALERGLRRARDMVQAKSAEPDPAIPRGWQQGLADAIREAFGVEAYSEMLRVDGERLREERYP